MKNYKLIWYSIKVRILEQPGILEHRPMEHRTAEHPGTKEAYKTKNN